MTDQNPFIRELTEYVEDGYKTGFVEGLIDGATSNNNSKVTADLHTAEEAFSMVHAVGVALADKIRQEFPVGPHNMNLPDAVKIAAYHVSDISSDLLHATNSMSISQVPLTNTQLTDLAVRHGILSGLATAVAESENTM